METLVKTRVSIFSYAIACILAIHVINSLSLKLKTRNDELEQVEANTQEITELDRDTMTKEEFSKASMDMAKVNGNLSGTDVDLFVGRRTHVRTSFDELNTIKNEASSNSIGISALLLKGSPKKTVNQEQLKNLLNLSYFLGAVNTAKEINFRLEHFYDYEEFSKDLAQGEAQLMLKGAWDALRDNRIGKQVFLEVDLADIMKDMDLNKFIRMPKSSLRL